jgi:multidrug efflux pump subunit AcrB
LGRSIRIKDIARVYYALEKATTLNRTNGLPSMDLLVLKKERADAIKMVELVRAKVEELRPTWDPRIKLDFVQDWSDIIKNRISILTGNLLLGLVLVLILLGALLPFRVALLTALGIPFSFLGTLIIFQGTGTTLNLISLIGLIIVSGMLVDDAIVVNDNAMRLLDEGKDPETAAIEGTQQIWPAVTASVMTTVVAFLPMMFMSGIFGKFVREIPIGVVAALVVSLLQSFLVLPGHFASYVKRGSVQTAGQSIGPLRRLSLAFVRLWDTRVLPVYSKIVSWVVRHRYITCFAVVALFAGSILLGAKGLKFILFPPDGVEIFMARAEAPDGTPLEITGELMRPIEREVAKIPEVELRDYVTTVGLHQQEPDDPMTKRGTHLGQVTVYLSPETERERSAAEIIDDLRVRVGTPPGVNRVVFERMQGGPPVGQPISIGIWGRNYPEILAAATDLRALVESTPGVQDVSDSYIKGREEIQIRIKPGEAEAAGLTPFAIGNTVRGAFDGIVATSIQELDDEVDVRVLFDKSARSDAGTLDRIQIPNPQGNLVPLTSIGKLEKAQGIASYEHENNQREIRVFGGVDEKITSATQANERIREKLPELIKKHPKVQFSFGGEDQDTQESLASLGRSFVIAIFGIFMILVLTLKSLSQPFLVLLTIPLGIIAVIWAFFFHGLPLSFMASLGIVALAGVIVNNAIVFIDFVNQARAEGMDRFASIEQAAKLRLRPIFLTTATTVVGLMPTAYGIGGIDRFVVPIAMSLGWGLLLGSLLTALTFPAALAVLDDVLELKSRLLSRVFRTRTAPG